METKTKTFRLPDKTIKQLKELSETWGVSMTDVIKIAIDMYHGTSISIEVDNETEVL